MTESVNGFHPNFPKERLEESTTAKQYGIDNTIPDALMHNALALSHVLGYLDDQVQIKWPGKRLRMTSAFRCQKLNSHPSIRGSDTSAHKMCLAADVSVPGVPNKELAEFFRDSLKTWDFDQIILEFNRWIHLGLAAGKPGRRQLISAVKRPNTEGKLKTAYVPGFVVA